MVYSPDLLFRGQTRREAGTKNGSVLPEDRLLQQIAS